MPAVTPSKAIVLFGHGARDPQWAEPMQRLQQILLASLQNLRVELAFLELMEPSLPAIVASLVGSGVSSIQVVPIFFGRGGHLKNDFPVLMQELKTAHPYIDISNTDAVGQWDTVWMAIAQEIIKSVDQ